MLKIVENKFLIGKELFQPYSVEVHYFRLSKRFWSVCFERIKRGGFRIISTVVPWNLHEDIRGGFDFTGSLDSRKDLIVFLELAREFGFKLILRPGPWIQSEWPNGGYPDYLMNMPELLARDAQGNPLPALLPAGVKGGFVPSYLHPRYQSAYKRYFQALADVLKHYVYPRGPVFLIELDSQTSFGGHTDPFKADYNDYILGVIYPKFLEEKYQDIKRLNGSYGEKNGSFNSVQPPRSFTSIAGKGVAKFLDWVEFREYILQEYLSTLKESLKQVDLATLFFYTHKSAHGRLILTGWQSRNSDDFFSGISLLGKNDFYLTDCLVRQLACSHDFSWGSDIPVGRVAADPQETKKYLPVGAVEAKFAIVQALAGGLKGFNLHSFVERDHWYGAPLASDGTVQPAYDILRKFAVAREKIDFPLVTNNPRIGLVTYRPYLWMDKALSAVQPQIRSLTESVLANCARDLAYLKIDYGVSELTSATEARNLDRFSILILPVSEMMDATTQQLLLKMLKNGKTILFIGALPQVDLSQKKCTILSRGLKTTTVPAPTSRGVEMVKGFGYEYAGSLFGLVKKSRLKKLAYANGQVVGVGGKIGKGKAFVFTFDLASQLDPHKLQSLEKLFSELKVPLPAHTSDPRVSVVLRRTEKHLVAFVLYPPAGNGHLAFPDHTSIPRNQVILRIDTHTAGIKANQLKITDLLGDFTLKTSASQLRRGIALELAPGDSALLLIARR